MGESVIDELFGLIVGHLVLIIIVTIVVVVVIVVVCFMALRPALLFVQSQAAAHPPLSTHPSFNRPLPPTLPAKPLSHPPFPQQSSQQPAVPPAAEEIMMGGLDLFLDLSLIWEEAEKLVRCNCH